jgi:hypothetical protein
MDMSRKTFLLHTAAGGAWLLTLGSCGGGGGADYGAGAPPPPPPPPSSGCAATIQDNHGHALAIPAADLNSAVAITYSILGAADHSHSVTFSAAQLAQLKAGQAVTVQSTTTFEHSHGVTETCT